MLEAVVSVLGIATIGIIGWAFQISNRVTAIEKEHEGLRELMITQFKEVNRRLDRIEEKL